VTTAHPAGPHPRDLADALTRYPRAITILVTLSRHGTLPLDRLHEDAGDVGPVTTTLAWLAAMGLIRRDSTAGTWDLPHGQPTYTLSDTGALVGGALSRLAEQCDTASTTIR
jgi:hypothetical protein